MIASFGDRATEDLFHGVDSRSARTIPIEIHRVALQKLDMLNAATTMQDLRSPPSNHLEKLRGDLHGLHSIRINRQYRLVFRWAAGNAEEVRIIDYHT